MIRLLSDSTCDLSLTLVKKTGADPAKLSSAILTFEVNGIPQGRPVKIDDAIRASLRILIPGGYHTTL